MQCMFLVLLLSDVSGLAVTCLLAGACSCFIRACFFCPDLCFMRFLFAKVMSKIHFKFNEENETGCSFPLISFH